MRRTLPGENLDLWARLKRAEIEMERAVKEIEFIAEEIQSWVFVDVSVQRQGHLFLWKAPDDDRIGPDERAKTMQKHIPEGEDVEVTIVVRLPK